MDVVDKTNSNVFFNTTRGFRKKYFTAGASLVNKKAFQRWAILVAVAITVGLAFRSEPEAVLLSDHHDLLSTTTTTINNNNKSKRLCRPSELTKGKWMPTQYDQLPYLPKQKERKMCYADLISPWNTYKWVPSADCFLADFSVPEFCRMAYNKTIALLGDSLSMEQFSSLVHTMGVTTFDEESTFLEDGPQVFDFHVCDGQTRLHFRRSNWIVELGSTLQTVEPDVLVVNRGAWYSPDDQLIGRINKAIASLQRWKRPLHFIWRTTVPGHPDCHKFHEPATSVQLMEEYVTNKTLYDNNETTIGVAKWHWYDFQHQNELVLEAFSKSKLEDWDILDAYAVNILRPDEHLNGDCLHNCQPGSKTMVLNRLLLHLMKLRATTRNETAGVPPPQST